MDRLTISNALNSLKDEKNPYKELFRHGSMRVEIYKPDRIDKQTPHRYDELYVIATGSGYFINEGNREQFEPGEVLFVPAGAEHRFEDFTEDFSTWVFFLWS